MNRPPNRRAALGLLSLAPLPVQTASAAEGASAELLRLIAEHDQIQALQEREGATVAGVSIGSMTAAAHARLRVMRHPSMGLQDMLAKAACLDRLTPLEEFEAELQQETHEWALIDHIGEALVIDLMRMARANMLDR